MLSAEDESFLVYWPQNREKQKTSIRPFFVGLSAGFSIGAAILLALESGWYERANMEANSRLSSVIFLLAIMLLSVFMAWLYRKFKWEMQEQRYHELAAKNKARDVKQP